MTSLINQIEELQDRLYTISDKLIDAKNGSSYANTVFFLKEVHKNIMELLGSNTKDGSLQYLITEFSKFARTEISRQQKILKDG